MKMITPKVAILETLNDMDNLQAEKVLEYIKTLLYSNTMRSTDYSRFKNEALQEIRRALSNESGERVLQPE